MTNNGFLKKLDDFLNPLLVREIRQSLRSNVFVAGVIIVILVSAIAMIVNIAWQTGNTNSKSGESLFYVVMCIIWAYGCIFVPAAAAHRFRQEDKSGEFELFHVTGISPLKIVIGKLQASLVMMLLVVFAAAPFLLACYFLKGISILEELLIMFTVIMGSVFCVSIGIFTGCGKSSKLMTLLANLAFGIFIYASMVVLPNFAGQFNAVILERPFLILTFGACFLIYEMIIIFASASRLDFKYSASWFYFKLTVLFMLNVFPLFLMSTGGIMSEKNIANTYLTLATLPIFIVMLIIPFDFENMSVRTKDRGAFSAWLGLCMISLIFWEMFFFKFKIESAAGGLSLILSYFAVLFLSVFLVVKFIIRPKKIYMAGTSLCAFGLLMASSCFAKLYDEDFLCNILNPFMFVSEARNFKIITDLYVIQCVFWILFFLIGSAVWLRNRGRD